MYQTRTATQTATQAKRLASRIGAELLQLRALYGEPSLDMIHRFTVEAEMYLAAGYLEKIEYGFKRHGKVVFELAYTGPGVRNRRQARSRACRLRSERRGVVLISFEERQLVAPHAVRT